MGCFFGAQSNKVRSKVDHIASGGKTRILALLRREKEAYGRRNKLRALLHTCRYHNIRFTPGT